MKTKVHLKVTVNVNVALCLAAVLAFIERII
jgi:hypothetical protein